MNETDKYCVAQGAACDYLEIVSGGGWCHKKEVCVKKVGNMEKMLDGVLKNIREFEDTLKVSVKIDHREILKVVVMDLIAKRNSPTNKEVASFDVVLKYYLGDADFTKYVINKEKIED